MATSSILLMPGSAVLPDGSASNASPGLTRRQGSESSPKKHYLTLDFDASTDEHAWWTFRMPTDYASGGTVKIQWMANATANSCVWNARIGAVTPSDADTPVEHAEAAASTTTTATNATEARRLNETSIALGNLDSLAAGDLVFLLIHRDADNGSDTLTVDAELIAASLEYTTT
jgi:hypothetical protein